MSKPKYGEVYYSLVKEYDENKNIEYRVIQNTWTGDFSECIMEALGNVFFSKEEALKRRDVYLERIKESDE